MVVNRLDSLSNSSCQNPFLAPTREKTLSFVCPGKMSSTMASIHPFPAEILVGDTFSRGFWKFSVPMHGCVTKVVNWMSFTDAGSFFFPSFVGLSYIGTPCQSQIVTTQFLDVPVYKIQVVASSDSDSSRNR